MARKAKKPVKRQDGKPTRREKSRANRGMYSAARRALRDTRPEPTKLRDVTDDIIEEVLSAIAKGDTVRGKCRELAVCEGTVRLRIAGDEQLTTRYARARMQQAHAFVEQNVIELDALDDIDTEADGANVQVQIAKHKFEVRRWTAGKYHVGAYGDKVTQVLEGNPDKPIQHEDLSSLTPEQASERYQERLRLMREKEKS